MALSEPSCSVFKLNHRKTPISDKEVSCIFESIRTNATIKEIDLIGNEISSRTTPAIVKAMRENRTVQILRLGTNNLGDEGVMQLSIAIQA